MTAADKTEYEKLATVADRAEWLLRASTRENGISVSHDIEKGTLSLVWRVSVLGIQLPGAFSCEKPQQAISEALAWLQRKADEPKWSGSGFGN